MDDLSSGTPQGLERFLTPHAASDAAPPPGRLAVGVIGTGRVGSVLGAALAGVQHRLVAVSAVSDASRSRAETLLPGVSVVAPPDVCAAADLVLVTVPDDVLPDLVRGLADVGAWRSGQLVVHTSGRFGVAVLQPATAMGALPLALHPVMTFTGTSLDLDRLVGCVFGVTAPPALVPIADALVLEVGGEPVHVPEEQRGLYHAALAHAANHLVTLVTSSVDLLRQSGIDDPARLLQPLLTAALDNALRVGDASLTGPVARGDAGTLRRHIDAIGAASVETRDAYVALARLTALRALSSGLLNPAQAEALLDVLAVKSGDA
jgi:predicted short-subunit dehydrogenase-like oxidoreductase (DUF2520 family)